MYYWVTIPTAQPGACTWPISTSTNAIGAMALEPPWSLGRAIAGDAGGRWIFWSVLKRNKAARRF